VRGRSRAPAKCAKDAIAKEDLSDVQLDAPSSEYRALRLVQHLDIAPLLPRGVSAGPH